MRSTPGARLDEVMSAVACVFEVDDDARVELLIAVQRLGSMVAGLQARVLSAFAVRAETLLAAGDRVGARALEDQAAAVMRVAPRGMRQRCYEAQLLVSALPQTLAALDRGDLGAGHVRRIMEGAHRLRAAGGAAEADPDPGEAAERRRAVMAEFEARVLAKAAWQTAGEVGRAVKRAVLRVDPTGAERRSREATAERRVNVEALDDGMALLQWFAPAVEIQAVYGRLDATARSLPSSDPRTLDQQRSDLFVDALLGSLSGDVVPRKQGRQVQANIHVTLSTMLGFDNNYGHLDGYGPLARGQALESLLAHDTTWRRLVTTDDGNEILDISKSYRPPQAIRDLIIANNPTCVAPGCGQPAQFSDLDHRMPHGSGGPTSLGNMCPACKRHHDRGGRPSSPLQGRSALLAGRVDRLSLQLLTRFR